MRDLHNRLQDILDAIQQIEIEAVKGKAAFDGSELIQVWMVHHLLIIGEAARSIDPAVRQRYPSIPWRQIGGMRNILVHDYFRINHEVVWETIEKHVPSLKKDVQQILQTLPPSQAPLA
jgi:uncharacterized protein with HEPN domain